MGIYGMLSKLKTKTKEGVKAGKENPKGYEEVTFKQPKKTRLSTRKEEKQIYKEEYAKERKVTIKSNARRDAKAGGRGKRLAKDALKQLRDMKKESSTRESPFSIGSKSKERKNNWF